MEGQQSVLREKSRPSFPRTASRSSTATRMTNQSNASSTSHPSSSPLLHAAHPVHRHNHDSCRKPSSPAPSSRHQLSREASTESARQTPVSSFLQERLQKERQSESHKLAASSSRTGSDMSVSVELGSAAQKSPVKNPGLDLHRPQSSSGIDPGQKKGFALKEMEQVVSGLHKQNFDLKLELYHRRERQTKLEDRLEALDIEKTQTEEMNQKLVVDLEKRDKAIEEAVAMIVTLEAKLDALTKERNMVRHVEAQGFFALPNYQGTPHANDESPRTGILDMSQLDDPPRVLSRQPSFVSDRSERTENLRNVYLGARGSVISLPRVAEGSDLDGGHPNGLASPTVSVLSESSFVSVYGRRGENMMVPSRVDEPLSLDGEISKNEVPYHQRAPSTRPDRQQTPRANSFSRANTAEKFQAIANVTETSPLQRIERRVPSYSHKRETPRPPSASKNISQMDTGKATRSPSRKKTREENRETMRRLMTDAPGGVSLNEPALPPTPDTVASSTLRRFKHSNDTLDNRCHDGMQGRSQESLPQLRSSNEKLDHENLAEQSVLSFDSVAPPPIQDRRKPARQRQSRQEKSHHPPRPRSADESTISHHRRNWDYDSDDSEDSFESSLDIWMRAGGAKASRGGRASPDLFGFPTSPSKGSWAMNAMSGLNPGYSGGANVQSDVEQMVDLGAAHDVIFGRPEGPVAPGPAPPPDRRSSLNAQTGPKTGLGETTPKPASRPKPRERVHRPRHVRRNSDDAQIRANMKTPAPAQLTELPPQQQAPTEQKKTYYPPIVGHGGVRAGLSRVFRRSLSGATSKDIPENLMHAEGGNVDTARNEQPLPAWSKRASTFDDDRSGATPPPILRNPQQSRSGEDTATDETSSAPRLKESALPAISTQEPVEGGHASAATGARRKWLPAFSRLSNKNG